MGEADNERRVHRQKEIVSSVGDTKMIDFEKVSLSSPQSISNSLKFLASTSSKDQNPVRRETAFST
jgi:hypothetical protein